MRATDTFLNGGQFTIRTLKLVYFWRGNGTHFLLHINNCSKVFISFILLCKLVENGCIYNKSIAHLISCCMSTYYSQVYFNQKSAIYLHWFHSANSLPKSLESIWLLMLREGAMNWNENVLACNLIVSLNHFNINYCCVYT